MPSCLCHSQDLFLKFLGTKNLVSYKLNFLQPQTQFLTNSVSCNQKLSFLQTHSLGNKNPVLTNSVSYNQKLSFLQPKTQFLATKNSVSYNSFALIFRRHICSSTNDVQLTLAAPSTLCSPSGHYTWRYLSLFCHPHGCLGMCM
jgi:hypothetical protein